MQKIMRKNVDIFTYTLRDDFNNKTVTPVFPATLKLTDVTPVFKKGSETCKENFRPVSILPNVAKLFEHTLFQYNYVLFLIIFSRRTSEVLGRGLLPITILFSWLKNEIKTIDKGKTFAALLTDLSQVLNWLPHDLIITKLNACGISLYSSRLIIDICHIENKDQE